MNDYTLEDGEVICDKCKGLGFLKMTEQRGKHFYPVKTTCNKCHGEGKLDWIDNVVGKEETLHQKLRNHGAGDEWFTWSSYDDEPTYKRSSEEIKHKINPNYRKQLERKIAYNLQRR